METQHPIGRATKSAIVKRMEKIMPTKGRQYISTCVPWFGERYTLNEYDENDPKGKYVRDLTAEEAESIEPGIVAKTKAERRAWFPAADAMDQLMPLEQKRQACEAGKISLTPEEKEELEREIKRLGDIIWPGVREEREARERREGKRSDGDELT